MDCNKTEAYFKEKERLCNSTANCYNCPLSSNNNGKNITCDNLQTTHPKKAIEIVQKWSDEHPQKTILSDFLEKYPNAPLNVHGIPEDLCPHDLGLEDIYEYCVGTECSECWNKPLQESENNG